MFRLGSVVAAVVLVLSWPGSGLRAEPAPDGIDLFLEACEWQGTNPSLIRTGFVEYKMTVLTPPPNEAAIQKEIAERVASLRKSIEMASNEAMQRALEKGLETLPKVVRERSSGRHESRVKVLFDGNDPSGKRRYEISDYDPATKKFDPPRVALRDQLSKEFTRNVVWDQKNRLAVLTKVGADAPDFQSFGRMQGMPSRFITAGLLQGGDLSQFKFNPDARKRIRQELEKLRKGGAAPLEIRGKLEYEKGATATIVETHRNGKVLQRYAIDAARGYVCPEIVLYDDAQRPLESWTSEGYFLHSRSGLWFPAKHMHTIHAPGTGQMKEQEVFELVAQSLELNDPVDPQRFRIDIPSGARVLDAHFEPPVHYLAVEPVALSLDKDGLKLTEIAGLRLSDTKATPGETSPGWSWRMAFLVLNVAAVLILLVIWSRRRWHTTTAGCLFFSLLGSSGCNSERVDVQFPVSVVPSKIDFGFRRATEPIRLECMLTNHGKSGAAIDRIVTGCGCTTLGDNPGFIQPLQSVKVPLHVNLNGRVGEFSSSVTVFIKGVEEPVVVGLRGFVTKDVWVAGGAVQCQGKTSETTAIGDFEVCTVEYPNVKLLLSDSEHQPNTSVDEIGRVNKGGVMYIRFRYQTPVTGGTRTETRHFTLKADNPNISPLDVSVNLLPPFSSPAPAGVGPTRIALGYISRGYEGSFQIFGGDDLVESLKLESTEGLPPGVLVELLRSGESKREARLTIRASDEAAAGFFSGKVHLRCSEGKEFSIALLGSLASSP